MTFEVDIQLASLFLKKIIKDQVSQKEILWINQQEDILFNEYKQRYFYLAFSSASRFIRKNKLQLTQDDLDQAEKIRKGFQPEHWNLLQCVRVYFLLMLPNEDKKSYEIILKNLYEAADLDEQVALYSALPLLPFPHLLEKRAAEGIRTNITDVFDAIALNNPYPQNFLNQNAWNQMVLKAVFMQRPLYRIYAADSRANPELGRMLVDFAHERWAAGRKVSPELWRFVGPYLNAEYLEDIKKIVREGESLEKKAGLLACAESSMPQAQEVLSQHPEVIKEIKIGSLNWKLIGKKVENDLK